MPPGGTRGRVPAVRLPAGVPWQTVVGAQQVDVRSLLASAGRSTADTAVRGSLRRPGLALGVTVILDALVVIMVGGSVSSVAPRAVLGLTTALAAVVVGRRGGWLRVVSGLLGGVTAVVQAGALVIPLVSGFRSGTSLLDLAPSAVAAASVLVMAVKTAVLALRPRR